MTTVAVKWSRADDKIFEGALVKFPDGTANRWEIIAGCLAGKTAMDVKVHYEALVFDVAQIEAGLIELPSYPELTDEAGPSSGIQVLPLPPPPAAAKGSESSKRKKGRAWTKEEHLLFLQGLEIYGQSDWRNISRFMVKTRQPCQVASHAQKYFNRQKSDKKNRKRSSIHDITLPSASIVENTSINENAAATNTNAAVMNFYANNNSSPSVGVSVSNDTSTSASASEVCDMINDTTTSVGVNRCVNNDATGVNPYYINNATGVGVNPYVNNDTTGAGVNSYVNNDAAGVGVNPYDNNGATGVGVDRYMDFDTTSFGENVYMNNDTSSVGGNLHVEDETYDSLWSFLECDSGNALLDGQSLPESSNTTNTNPTSVSAPADANADANANANANANADTDANFNLEMLEWPSDPGMDSVF